MLVRKRTPSSKELNIMCFFGGGGSAPEPRRYQESQQPTYRDGAPSGRETGRRGTIMGRQVGGSRSNEGSAATMSGRSNTMLGRSGAGTGMGSSNVPSKRTLLGG